MSLQDPAHKKGFLKRCLIAIALADLRKDEEKAQGCEIA